MVHEPWMDDRIGALERGENPAAILRMKSGYAVLGDSQFLPGYCVLLRTPRAESLNGLSIEDREQFTRDMMLVGDAILGVCRPAKINYAVMMNLDSFLHAHIQARYAWEPDEYRFGPVWNYPAEQRNDERFFCTGEPYQTLREQLKTALQNRLREIGYWEE